jgi:bisanhydrobacterioruberin hydratase
LKRYLTRYKIAIFIAILFHVSGFIGILFTPYADWFIQNTSLNLLLMFGLLVYTQHYRSRRFYLFILVAFVVGMFTEMIGVNTGKLFGHYHYGSVMGPKLLGVPFLIGINWFVVVYSAGIIMRKINIWLEAKYLPEGEQMRPGFKAASFIIDGALLATFFDFIMEPVAIELKFWQWHTTYVPFYNYVCWFFISAFLLILFRKLNFNKNNHFAVHLFIIQSLFFIALQIFL